MNTFQIVVIGGFIVLLLLGVLIFAGILPGFRAPSGGTGGTVIWWGTLPAATLAPVLAPFKEKHKTEFALEYVEQDSRDFESQFIEALASGRGPDLILLPDNLLLKQTDKLFPIPYDSFSRRQFQDTFARGAEIYLGPDGALGLPLYVDPLALYYNRDLLTTAGLGQPPATWTEVGAAIGRLRQSDVAGNLSLSPIGLGEFNNLAHAKDLVAWLMLQAGTPIVERDQTGAPQVVLQDSFGFNKQPAGEAVAFFNRFADPANSFYAWNSALPEARELFARGGLAMYFGYGSEWPLLKRQNPLLDFDLALPPQREAGLKSLTLGRFPAVAVVKNSKNLTTAFTAAFYLAGREFAEPLAAALALPPARLELLAAPPTTDAALAALYRAAVMAETWLDPDPVQSREIFRRLVDSTQVGAVEMEKALNQADTELEALLLKK